MYVTLVNINNYQVLVQHSSNLYAANGAGVVLAEKGHYDVAKELLTQVSGITFFTFFNALGFAAAKITELLVLQKFVLLNCRFKRLQVEAFLSRCQACG